MNLNTKLEVAVDIMSTTIADAVKAGCDENSKVFQKLMEEKVAMYNCDEKVLDKIINVYGKRIRG